MVCAWIGNGDVMPFDARASTMSWSMFKSENVETNGEGVAVKSVKEDVPCSQSGYARFYLGRREPPPEMGGIAAQFSGRTLKTGGERRAEVPAAPPPLG
ncbi:MAG: hypothetical protein JWP30_743 [Homoserinimonas sp.]|nr:hypothetical protein [Homoserinimonas sp.]